ncbi:MAG TPA: hypothetical protein VEY96_08475, partial [Actinomycetes bacterium]|nr:hypothetical protein [Actinomycetes bacterium]
LLAPLHYAIIVGVGIATFVVMWAGILAFASVAGQAGGVALTPFLIGLPIVYVHGVQGAMFGYLARTRPAIFA